MATYKVIQDIEAEDHFIWRLSLKQLIYALIGVGLIWLGWFLSAQLTILFFIALCIPAAPFIFLALPLGLDQPNDIWLLARLNFIFKPKQRLWQQIGNSYKFLTILDKKQAPKRPSKEVLSDKDLKHKLDSLSAVLDSHGQAVLTDKMAAETGSWENQHSLETNSLDGFFGKLLNKQHSLRHQQASQHLHRKVKLNQFKKTKPSRPQRSTTPGPQKLPPLEHMQDFKISTLEQMVGNNKQAPENTKNI